MDYLVPTAERGAGDRHRARRIAVAADARSAPRGWASRRSMTVPAVIANAVSDALAPARHQHHRAADDAIAPARAHPGGPPGRPGVKPPRFEYHAPTTIDEAVALLARYGGEAKVLAGGQSLMPLLNFRLSRPAALDRREPHRAAGLRARGQRHTSRFGAMTRQRTIEFSPVVAPAPAAPDRGDALGRSPADPLARHHRRLARPRRSLGGVPGGADRARRSVVVAQGPRGRAHAQRRRAVRDVPDDAPGRRRAAGRGAAAGHAGGRGLRLRGVRAPAR